MKHWLTMAVVAGFCANAASISGPSGELLLDAIQKGDTAAVRSALKGGANPNVRNADGTPALMQAAVYAGTETMEVLLDAGADPQAKSAAGATALLWAAGDYQKVQLLIAKGANVNVRSQAGNTPLMVAAGVDGNYQTVRLLIAKGADVNAKNTTPFPMAIPVGAPGGTALHNAAMCSDPRMAALLIEHGAQVDARDQIGATPLMLAAATGQLQDAKLFIDHGADVNAAMGPGLTPLMFAAIRNDTAMIRLLLQKGAQVNAKDKMSGATPLMWASGSDSPKAAAVRELLRAGADPEIKNAAGETASAWSKKRGEGEISTLLQPVSVNAQTGGLQPAVQKALDLLQKSGPQFSKVSGCASCHNQSLPAMAVALARQHGYKIDEDTAQKQRKATLGVYSSAVDIMWESSAVIPDVANSTSYALLGLSAEEAPAGPVVYAMAHDVAARQQVDGHWVNWAPRPPLEQSDLVTTALSVRALQSYTMPGRRQEFQARIDKARDWLVKSVAMTNDEKAFRLLGLTWADAAESEIRSAAQAVIEGQRADGGWGQLSALPSDAYATGQALIALVASGTVEAEDAIYRKGVRFLLGTQKDDGSWLVKSRAFPFQPYRESGFPHGKDQWISAAGTSWAVMALAFATPQ